MGASKRTARAVRLDGYLDPQARRMADRRRRGPHNSSPNSETLRVWTACRCPQQTCLVAQLVFSKRTEFMRTKLLVLSMLLIGAFTCTAQTRNAATLGVADPKLEQELRKVARDRILAFDTGDPSIWSPVVDDSYIIATPTGPIRTKQQVMQGFRPPLPGY